MRRAAIRSKMRATAGKTAAIRKTIEESFRDSDLVRCHRKYIVNMSKVRVLSREKGGYFLELDSDLIDPIPISKTYEEAALARFYAQRGGLTAPLV